MPADSSEVWKLARVLVLEDNAVQQAAIQHILTKEGFEVVICGSAQEAQNHFDARDIDVAVIDLHLPDISQKDLLVRAASLCEYIPVIIYTAFSSVESARAAVNIGAFAYVEKTGDWAELVRQVHRAVQRRLSRLTEGLERSVAETDATLRKREAMLAEAQKLARIGAFAWNPRDNSLEWSDNMFAITGLDRDGFSGQFADTMQRIIHQDDRDATITSLRATVARQNIWSAEFRIVRPDGNERILRSHARFVTDPQGGGPLCIGACQDITEEKRQEQRLRDSETKFRNLVGTTADCVWQIDARFRYNYASISFLKVSGYEPEELIGRCLLEYVPAAERGHLRALLGKLAASRARITNLEVTMRHKKGYPLTFELNAVPLVNPKDELEGYFGVSRDVTERRAAYEAVRRSEERYRALVNSSLEHIFSLSLDGEFLSSNNRISCCDVGQNESIIGRKVWQVFDGQVAELLHEHLQETLRLGAAQTFEADKDVKGRKCHYLITLYPMTREGVIWAVGGICRDITAIKAAHKRIESQARFSQDLIDNIPAPVFYKDARGRYLGGNRAFAEFCRCSQEQFVGKTIRDLASPGDAAIHEQADAEVMKSGRKQYEISFANADGVTRDILVHKARFDGLDGGASGLVGVMFDVTESRQLQRQVLHAQKMEAVGQLAGGVAHDFRNQLTIIQGFGAMLLRRGQIAPQGREKMAEILKAAERSTRLTQQLLAFSRREVIKPEMVCPSGLIQGLAKSLPRMIGEDVRLHLDLPAHDDCYCELDPGQFQQAIINLAINARDAMPHGGELCISSRCTSHEAAFVQRFNPEAPPGEYIVITVRDNGEGMDEATLAHIFEPFYTTKEVGRGTGLGLAMVYGFVHQSGGFIEVDSAPGQGAEFRLHFPRAARATPVTGSSPQESSPCSGHETILVVEDEDAVRRLLVGLLEENGYRTLQADRADTALELLLNGGHKPDMIITDMVMPDKSGIFLTEQVRRRWPDMPVLYVSGYAGDELNRRGLTELDIDILMKPFEPGELLAKVAALKKQRTRSKPS